MNNNAISGWDLLDATLQALPLSIVVAALTLVANSISPSSIPQTVVVALSAFVGAVQFAYYMNQLANPRVQVNGTIPKSVNP